MNLRFRFFVIFALLAGMGMYMSFHRDLIIPLAKPFGEFPPAHKGWRMAGQSSLSDDVIKVLMPTDYLSRRYVASDGAAVDMYLSFFDGGPDSGGIHSPKHCMPGSGWYEMSSERRAMEVDGDTVNLVWAVYAMGETREVICYWFSMRGQTISDEYSLKLAEITGSLFHRRRDQSFIRISMKTRESVQQAEKRIEEFLQDFYPLIKEFLPS